MVVLALPVFGMRLSEGDPRMLPESTATRQMYEALEVHFPDANRPDPIVAVAAGQPDDPAVRALRDRIAGVDGVTAVETAAGPAPWRCCSRSPVRCCCPSRPCSPTRSASAPRSARWCGCSRTAISPDYRHGRARCHQLDGSGTGGRGSLRALGGLRGVPGIAHPRTVAGRCAGGAGCGGRHPAHRAVLVPATMTLLNRYNWCAPEPLRRAHTRIGLREEEPALVG